MNDYDPVQLVKDAARFKRSAFGQHYLARLETRIGDAKRRAVDTRLTREQRADQALIASEAQSQLDYFTTAEKTAGNPTLLKRLADGFKKRMSKQENADG
jgi:hypothetical protein